MVRQVVADIQVFERTIHGQLREQIQVKLFKLPLLLFASQVLAVLFAGDREDLQKEKRKEKRKGASQRPRARISGWRRRERERGKEKYKYRSMDGSMSLYLSRLYPGLDSPGIDSPGRKTREEEWFERSAGDCVSVSSGRHADKPRSEGKIPGGKKVKQEKVKKMQETDRQTEKR